MTRRVFLHAVLAGLGVGGFSWLFGVEGWRPLLLGACTIAVVAVVVMTPPGYSGPWPPRPSPAYGGGTSQVWRLADRLRSLRSSGERDAALQFRLRRLAVTKLSRHGIAWDDPRAAEALGDDAYAALTSDDFRTDLRDVDRVVTAIENLDQYVSGGTTP